MAAVTTPSWMLDAHNRGRPATRPPRPRSHDLVSASLDRLARTTVPGPDEAFVDTLESRLLAQVAVRVSGG